MHLEGPWLSTIGRKRGRKKWASAEQKRQAEKLNDSWNELKRKWGEPVAQKQQKYEPLGTSYRTGPPPGRETRKYNSVDTGGVATLAAPKVYTGTKVKGIATMHKSNAVPVFSDDEAVEISKMRR
jgi:hypothetical protein